MTSCRRAARRPPVAPTVSRHTSWRTSLCGLLGMCASSACNISATGTPCRPDDAQSCPSGFHCLTVCRADGVSGGTEGICAPALGEPVGDVFEGQGLIDGRGALDELANVREIHGSLRVRIDGVAGLVLPRLERVDGDLSIVESADLECLALPVLSRVAGALIIDDNPRLRSVDLSSLDSADTLSVTGDESLDALAFPSLRTLGPLDEATPALDAEIADNQALTDVDLQLLERARMLRVHLAPAAAADELQVSLDSFVVGCLDVVGFDAEDTCLAPADGGDGQCEARQPTERCCTCVSLEGTCSLPTSCAP